MIIKALVDLEWKPLSDMGSCLNVRRETVYALSPITETEILDAARRFYPNLYVENARLVSVDEY